MSGQGGSNTDDLNAQLGGLNVNDGGEPVAGSSRKGRRFIGSTRNQKGSMTPIMAPIAKADMPYKAQEFLTSPSKTIEDVDNPTMYGKQVVVSNYFKMSAPSAMKLYQYDISYKNFKDLAMRKREDTREIFWSAYDSEKHGYIFKDESRNKKRFLFNDINLLMSMDQLELGENSGKKIIKVELRGKSYEMTIVFVGLVDIDLGSADPAQIYLATQLLDAVVTQIPSATDGDGLFFTKFGTSIFYHPLENRMTGFSINLGNGLQALTGLHGAVKPDCRGGLLYNVDISHSVFYKQRLNAIEFACEVLVNGKYELNERKNANYWRSQLELNSNQNSGFRYEVRQKLNGYFKGMKFCTTYEPVNRTYKYLNIGSKAAVYQMFNFEGREISVAEYFRIFKNINPTYPFLPCIEVKRKGMFIPIELLETTVTPIRYKGQVPERVLTTLIREAAWKPERRFAAIEAMCYEQNPLIPPHLATNDIYMDNFGVRMDKTLVPVQASILPAPTLKFGDGIEFDDKNNAGAWNLTERVQDKIRFSKIVEPMTIKIVVGMIIVRANTGDKDIINDTHYVSLMNTLLDFGVDVHEDCQKKPVGVEHGVFSMNNLEGFKICMKNFKDYATTKYPDCTPLCLFLLPFKSTRQRTKLGPNHIFSQYGQIKYNCDVVLGLNSQCILREVYDKITGGGECTTAINIALKIMAKLGIKHYDMEREGSHENWTKLTNPLEPTLILGVDVTHAGIQDRRMGDHAALSVASVVGNVDTDCGQYDTSVRVQNPGQERTVNMKDEIKNRILAFKERNNDIRPSHIVVYRDGVSETEFQKTLYEEKMSIEEACGQLGEDYKPTLTYIVVSKRHHTRFAKPADQNKPTNIAGCNNVSSGTLVEGTVTSKSYFDFFLVSHTGVMGTSRPTHYYVLYDSWKPSYDFWQTITHALTYAYVRCPRSISQPAPVMYAHLAAKRAKEYLNAYVTANDTKITGSNYEQFVKLNLEIQKNKDLKGMIFL